MNPKWEENLKQLKEKELREQLVDNPQIRLLKTVTHKAKSILKQFKTCDSAVKVSALVEGFDKVISKLDENIDESAKTNAVALCPDLRSSDVCAHGFPC